MPKRPMLSGDDVCKALVKLGFERARQKGSHVVYKKRTQDGEIGCVVPLHDEILMGTLRSICRQAQITLDDLYENT